MTRCGIFLLAFTLATVAVGAKSQDYRQEVRNLALPMLDIFTVNAEEPTCDYVTHPEGSMGESITNASKVPARMYMTLQTDTLFDSGEYEKDKSGLTIKIRGNTSAYGVKKPYKLKLQKKKDLLLRGDDATYKDKNWLLMPLSIYTITGLKLNELIGMPYTPQYRFVNVCINGDYRGIYMLMESVERNEQCRINVAKNGGFIVELDPYWWNEDVCFSTIMHKYNGKSYKYTFKYPDPDDVDEDIISHIQETINEMEMSMAEGTYPDVIDVETFAKWLLGHDILGTWDAGGSNRFFAKYDDGVFKIFIPCMWDFDSMAKMDNEWSKIHQDDIYYKMLFQSTNSEFTDTYLNLWEDLSDDLFTEINQYFENVTRTNEWDAVEFSLLLDQKRWNYKDCTLAKDAENVCKWLTDRRKWISNSIDDVKRGDTGTKYNYVYSIDGVFQCLYKDFLRLPRGIYIVNRKKVFIK
ncbi:MAG: CotH kinase family protein [Prevotellaceae bacterium]|nr:CotH kinase family protein [Prevotellaceae bacterium]